MTLYINKKRYIDKRIIGKICELWIVQDSVLFVISDFVFFITRTMASVVKKPLINNTVSCCHATSSYTIYVLCFINLKVIIIIVWMFSFMFFSILMVLLWSELFSLHIFRSNKSDVEFDTIIGHIEDIIIGMT